MKWICVIAILLCFTSVKTNRSILTDEKNKTLSSVETIKSESYELTLLRLMINQETTLRLNLVKHVHELISDVSLIKQSFRASETTIEGLKQTIVSLQRENMQLNNSSNARISELETKLQRVNEYINSVGEQKTSITGLQQTIKTFTIQVNSLQEENGEIKNRSINNHARIMELKTKLRTVNEDVNTQFDSLQLECNGINNETMNNFAMIMELKTRLQTVNESVSSLHEHVDVIQRESNRKLFNRTNGVLGDIRVEIRNLSRTFSDFRKHREAENELMENLENHFNSSLGNSTYANSPTSKKFNSLEAHFSDNLYRTFAHFETNLKTLKNEQVKLSSAVDSLENVHVNNCKNWTFGLSCDECACVQLHSEFCDKKNGQCHCKQGYTGNACQCEDNGGPCQHHIRLVNADNITSMGRVEVVTNGVWSTVCDKDWDHDDATVVCKQLGLGMNGIGVSNATFGKGIGPNFISEVDCKGNETDIFNCSFVKLSCSHANDAGVICVNKSDSIRLVNGSFATNGRLEVRLEGRGPWGTVCDDGFTKNDARVACRELGLPTRHVEVKASAFYGRGSGFILTNHLSCTGNESSLQLCPKQKHPLHCVHSEDVGVSCFNDCPSFTYGVECEKTCICDQNKSLSCDKDTGECLCKDGWAGVRCMCRNKSDCDENSYCDGTSCVCNDGFLTKTSNCSGEDFVLYSCSFETDLKMCSITNYGKMKWKRHSKGTSSGGTGPYSAKEGTFYVYTEASGGSKGDEGVMKISLTNLNLTTYACIQFYYHMRGRGMGELDVIIEDKSGSEVGRWSRSGNINSDWNQGLISLPANAEMVKVTGRRGDDYTSDIALDDLKIFYCLNKSDSIRLVNGSFVTNGRLEVRLEGRGPWVTVCDDGFTKNDARVACRELGLPTRRVEVKAFAFYGEGSGLILMNLLSCTGNESSLQLCQKQIHPSNCNHSEDVGVSCFNDCPSFTYGVECEKTCTCDQNKALSCDKDTGECLCKDGWAGVRCTCRNKSDCDENSYCDGTSCVCNDGFLTKTSNCSGEVFVLYSCSFETDLKTCSITNYGKMKWKRHSRGTLSDNTGPYSAKEGTFYVYTEASGGSKGDEGVMEISLTNLNLTTYACFQFYYHMRGEDMGELDVIIGDKSGSEVGRWSRSGNVNSDWNQGFISLPANAEMVKVTGRRGNGFTSDIALDGLKLFHCLMPDHVAFHAVAYSPTNNAVVILDHVITNVGGGYDNTTGVFTVPTPGLYVFSWTIETYGQRTEAVLLVNGVQQALSRADQASSYYDTTTSFAVLKLSLGDEVKVKVTTGSAQAIHTMFSGWRINKTDDIAFFASLSLEVEGSTIVFDNETLDTDSAYSTSTGRFVAPCSGLYVFMMSATANGSPNFYTKFFFSNGNSQPKVWVDSDNSSLYDSSSYMSFGWLNAGDYVYVDAKRMSTHSMFAGWQLVGNSSAFKSNYPVFLAHLSSRSSKTPVIFDKTHSSYHHGYSVRTGAFTADRDGVYLFLYNIEAHNEIVRTTLRVNGIEKFETRSDGRHSDYDDTSAVTVLELSVNDQVSVGVKDGTVDNPESLFFGVLLIEM